MEQQPTIQWFPGHMARTRRKLGEVLPQIDLVAELRDARIPYSSRNPELDELTVGKPRLILLNKADLAEESSTAAWIRALTGDGKAAFAVDCKSGRGVSQFENRVRDLLQDKLAQWVQKGMTGRAVRVLVAGIPNVGKSSFINCMARGGKAKAEDRPGVTRDQRWFVTASGIQLLDTPGVLWPKFEDQTVAAHLAYTGAIRDEILDCEELAFGLLGILRERYESLLRARYRLTEPFPEDTWELLQRIGRKRGMLIAGGEVDTERASIMLLDEFRGGKIGRITLEQP